MSPRIALWVIVSVLLVSIYIVLPKLPGSAGNFTGKFPLKLGLDLSGGVQLVLEAQMDKIPNDQKDVALESAKNVIERRVNLFGVSEAVVQTSKLGDKRRILVDLPGLQDASDAANLIGKTAQLEFRERPASPSAEEATESAIPEIFNYIPTGLSGSDLQKAQVVYGSGGGGGPQVEVSFSSDGAKKFAEITKRNIGRPLAIFLDNEIISSPVVNQEIIGGVAVITGQFSIEEAKGLAVHLNAGALPVPIRIVEQRVIGASLGQESINKSLVAGIVGLFTVAVFMVFYYGRLGMIANLALVIYSLLILGIFKTGLFLIPPITLTLAGIAGFILSIGMAVDANILIFERIKEERRWGKGKLASVDAGFKRAWGSIRDSNISSLITASILYFIGTGSVKGFAITLGIGVLVSMFSAITVTRTILKLVTKEDR